MIILYLLILAFILVILFVLIIFLIMQIIAMFTTDAPFVPIPKEIESDIISALELTPNSVLYDLGCGDARILLKAVQNQPKIKTIGVDIGLTPYFIAKFFTRKYPNITIKREDIFKTDISDATHIFLYLYPSVINKLIAKIRNQSKPGTRIVSCDFEITNMSPTRTVDLNRALAPRGKKLFIYQI